MVLSEPTKKCWRQSVLRTEGSLLPEDAAKAAKNAAEATTLLLTAT